MSQSQAFSDTESYQAALAKARQWCASAEQCLWDIEQKLSRSGCSAPDLNHILQCLSEDGFIDEKRYALAFANDKFNFLKWGKNKISSALWKKKIPEQFIAMALERIDAEEYRDTLIALLNRKKQELRRETPLGKKQKLVRFALQKGYEPEMVYGLLRMTDELAATD